MAITSAMEAIEIAPGGALPEEIVKFVAKSFSLSEFMKGHPFEWREHLILLQGDVKEIKEFGVHQHCIFAKIIPV